MTAKMMMVLVVTALVLITTIPLTATAAALDPLADFYANTAYDLAFSHANPVLAAEARSLPADHFYTTPSQLRFYCPPAPFSATGLSGEADAKSMATEPRPEVTDTRSDSAILSAAMALLEPIKRIGCLSIQQGWWAYRYCHEKHVVQLHDFGDAAPPLQYVLGRHQFADPPELLTHGGKRYVSVRYRNGTECDLTGRFRTIEVQYHCSPTATDDGIERMSIVNEVSVCNYQLSLHTPRLCAEPAFHSATARPTHLIGCRPVLAGDLERDQWYIDSMAAGNFGNRLGPFGSLAFQDSVRQITPPPPGMEPAPDTAKDQPAEERPEDELAAETEAASVEVKPENSFQLRRMQYIFNERAAAKLAAEKKAAAAAADPLHHDPTEGDGGHVDEAGLFDTVVAFGDPAVTGDRVELLKRLARQIEERLQSMIDAEAKKSTGNPPQTGADGGSSSANAGDDDQLEPEAAPMWDLFQY
ncbi:hypothetical protein BC828DRAFT_151863 [Blastocladiella britannica]|nr:hypothetical protein BC828DRAFT_151863 [Blastocladiella britannica]